MYELLIALGGTIVGGVLVWIIQQFYLNRRESDRLKAEKVIRSGRTDKIITSDIFFDLAAKPRMRIVASSRKALPHGGRRSRNPEFWRWEAYRPGDAKAASTQSPHAESPTDISREQLSIS